MLPLGPCGSHLRRRPGIRLCRGCRRPEDFRQLCRGWGVPPQVPLVWFHPPTNLVLPPAPGSSWDTAAPTSPSCSTICPGEGARHVEHVMPLLVKLLVKLLVNPDNLQANWVPLPGVLPGDLP